MVTVSKKIEYAMMLVSFLAEKEGKENVSLLEVSRQLHLPYRFLSQLASELKNNGILSSKEGRGGGYKLVKTWRNLSLYDLVVALGEDKNMVECLCSGKTCKMSGICGLKSVWVRLEKDFMKELKNIKLEDI